MPQKQRKRRRKGNRTAVLIARSTNGWKVAAPPPPGTGTMPMTIESFFIRLLIGVSGNPAFFPMLNEPSFRSRFCWRRGETGVRGEASPMPGKLVFCPSLSSGIHGSVFELQLTPKETRS